jgi:hypothetical protein
LQVHDEQGIADLVAMLQTAGMMILSIRQLTPPVAAGGVVTSASCPPELIPRG